MRITNNQETLVGKDISEVANQLLKRIKEKNSTIKQITGRFDKGTIEQDRSGIYINIEPYEKTVPATLEGVESLLTEQKEASIIITKERDTLFSSYSRTVRLYDPRMNIKVNDSESEFLTSTIKDLRDKEVYSSEKFKQQILKGVRSLTKYFPSIKKQSAKALRTTQLNIREMQKKPLYLVLETHK